MATNEEIRSSRLLGYIEKNSDRIYTIAIIGYRNSSLDNNIVALDLNRAKSIFPPNGKIFAYLKNYNIGPNKLIECRAKKNDSLLFPQYPYALNRTKDSPVNAYVHKIINIKIKVSFEKGCITPEEIKKIVDSTNISSLNSFFYLKYEGHLYGLFKYDNLKKSIAPAGGTSVDFFELNQSECINYKGQDFFIGKESSLKKVGVVDFMDDNQLADWFKDLLQSEIASERFLSITNEEFRQFTN